MAAALYQIYIIRMITYNRWKIYNAFFLMQKKILQLNHLTVELNSLQLNIQILKNIIVYNYFS